MLFLTVYAANVSSAIKKYVPSTQVPVESEEVFVATEPQVVQEDKPILLTLCELENAEHLDRFIQENPGLDLDAKDQAYGESALHYCALHNLIDCAQVLLKKGANVNLISGNGFSALHYALYDHHLDLFKLLLAFNADISIKDCDDETPLEIAKNFAKTVSSYNDIVSLLESRQQSKP